MKTALVLGAGGFIGSHLVKRLREEGYWVRGVDLKYPEHWETKANEFIIGDLRNPMLVSQVMFGPKQSSLTDTKDSFDEVYQLAADMGGAGYVFTGENDADIMHNSALINLNVVREASKQSAKKVFYSSSACIYPGYNQLDPSNPNCKESSAYPSNPDSEYGWEKLFSERLYLNFRRNYGLDIRIARFHNIFGPYGTWKGGKEKAPAAMCRKVSEADSELGNIEVWGDGKQTRSFLYIDECVEAILRLMNQDSFFGPVNIGSEEMVSVNKLAEMVIEISKKNVCISNIEGEEFDKKYGFRCPTGVRGRNSDNTLYFEKMGWKPSQPLYDGLKQTYEWINNQVDALNTI